MNEGIHLDLDTWIVPGQIRKANLLTDIYIVIKLLTSFDEWGYPPRVMELGRIALMGLQ